MKINKDIIFHMVQELSPVGYAYDETLQGCFDYSCQKFNIDPTDLDKQAHIDAVMKVMVENFGWELTMNN